MKWLLMPVDETSTDFGLIIEAEDEQSARRLASILDTRLGPSQWMHPECATCDQMYQSPYTAPTSQEPP